MKMPRMSEDRVQDNQLPSVGFNVQGEDFGQENIQQMTTATRGMLDEASNIAIKAQREADEAVQLDAGTRLAQFELSQNKRIRESRGENAMGLDKLYNDDYVKLQSDMDELAKNPKQKAMISRLMLSTDSQLRNNIATHTSREMDEMYDNKSKAMIEMDRKAAIDSMNPERVAESIGKQKAIIEQMAKKNGWSAEELQLSQIDTEKETTVDFIQRIAETDTDLARKTLSEQKEIIGGEMAIKMEGYITRRERQLKYLAKDTQVNNDIAFMIDFASGKDVNAVLKSKNSGITSELAKAVVAYQTDPDIIMVEDTPVFTTYAEKIFDTNDKASISGLLVDTLSGGADGKPNMKEIQSLVKLVAIRSHGMTLQEFDEKRKASKRVVKKSFVDNAFDAVKAWTSSFSSDKETTARVYKDLINEVDKNPPKSAEEANKVVSSVVERAQAQTNPNRTAYKIDQQIKAGGKVWVVTGFDEDGEPLVDEVK